MRWVPQMLLFLATELKWLLYMDEDKVRYLNDDTTIKVVSNTKRMIFIKYFYHVKEHTILSCNTRLKYVHIYTRCLNLVP